MRILPWIDVDRTPKGRHREAIVGLQVEVTLLEVKAWWRRLLKGRKGKIVEDHYRHPEC